MTTLSLTPEFIRSGLQCPPGKLKEEFCDKDLPGFRVEVSARSPGKGTYYFSYRSDGKRAHQKLGLTTDTTLAEARKHARNLKAEIQLGADPRGEEKTRRACITVEEFFEDHYLPYVKPRKRSYERDEELYRLRIKPAFGSKRLNELTRGRFRRSTPRSVPKASRRRQQTITSSSSARRSIWRSSGTCSTRTLQQA